MSLYPHDSRRLLARYRWITRDLDEHNATRALEAQNQTRGSPTVFLTRNVEDNCHDHRRLPARYRWVTYDLDEHNATQDRPAGVIARSVDSETLHEALTTDLPPPTSKKSAEISDEWCDVDYFGNRAAIGDMPHEDRGPSVVVREELNARIVSWLNQVDMTDC